MRYSFTILLFILLFVACKEKEKTTDNVKATEFNQALADRLKEMTKIDQYYAGIPQGKYKGDWNSWYVLRDSVNKVHKKVLDSILQIHGYPGFDLVGEEGESDFWVMVQHSDFDPEFQASILPLLKEQMAKKNAKARHYGLLTDRVRKNMGRPQLYGTQVDYNANGQAYIKSLEDSANVNKRRKELGMELLEVYLNGMTEMHFTMNKDYLLEKGIQEPLLYKIPEE